MQLLMISSGSLNRSRITFLLKHKVMEKQMLRYQCSDSLRSFIAKSALCLLMEYTVLIRVTITVRVSPSSSGLPLGCITCA